MNNPFIGALARAERVLAERWTEIEQLRQWRTPASRQQLNITKALLDAANAEIETLERERYELLCLLRGALRHVISEGDDTLATLIAAATARGERK